jgi:hypothetical protein
LPLSLWAKYVSTVMNTGRHDQHCVVVTPIPHFVDPRLHFRLSPGYSWVILTHAHMCTPDLDICVTPPIPGMFTGRIPSSGEWCVCVVVGVPALLCLYGMKSLSGLSTWSHVAIPSRTMLHTYASHTHIDPAHRVRPNTHGVHVLVCLYGIESPGLTPSLAIAEHVRALLEAG